MRLSERFLLRKPLTYLSLIIAIAEFFVPFIGLPGGDALRSAPQAECRQKVLPIPAARHAWQITPSFPNDVITIISCRREFFSNLLAPIGLELSPIRLFMGRGRALREGGKEGFRAGTHGPGHRLTLHAAGLIVVP